jgi:hypothetical protein
MYQHVLHHDTTQSNTFQHPCVQNAQSSLFCSHQQRLNTKAPGINFKELTVIQGPKSYVDPTSTSF